MKQISSKNFFPECYIDTNLVETLFSMFLQNAKGVNHQHSCGKVCSTMEKRMEGNFAVGIIDKDKKQPSYVNQCCEIGSTDHLYLLKHKDNPHFLIMISPAMEGFILHCAEEAQVDLKECGLCNDLNGLKKKTKTPQSKNDKRFKQAFKAMKDSKEIQIMVNVLKHLYKNGYKSDEKILKSFFE